MCSGVTPPKPGQVVDVKYRDDNRPFMQVIEPTVIEVLEAANGLRDPDTLWCYRVAIGQPISLEKPRGFFK